MVKMHPAQPGHGDQTQLLLEWEGTFGNLVGGTINTFINLLTDQGDPCVCSPCRNHIGVSTQSRSYMACILISTCPANKSASVEPHWQSQFKLVEQWFKRATPDQAAWARVGLEAKLLGV